MSITHILGRRKIVLGSGSEGRKWLLRKWGWDFRVVKADVDEKNIRSDNPKHLTLSLAQRKREEILSSLLYEPTLLITSDTVIEKNGKILEKPTNEMEARSFFEEYQTSIVKAWTAIAVADTLSGRCAEGVDSASIFFSSIPAEVVNKIVSKDETYCRAGGFTIEDPILEPYIEKIEGEKETVTGLPKKLTIDLIKEVL